MKISDVQIGDYLYIDAPRPAKCNYYGVVVGMNGGVYGRSPIVETVNDFGEVAERHIDHSYIVHNMTSTIAILSHL